MADISSLLPPPLDRGSCPYGSGLGAGTRKDSGGWAAHGLESHRQVGRHGHSAGLLQRKGEQHCTAVPAAPGTLPGKGKGRGQVVAQQDQESKDCSLEVK